MDLIQLLKEAIHGYPIINFILFLIFILFVSYFSYKILNHLLRKLISLSSLDVIDDIILTYERPLKFLFPVLFLHLAFPFFELSPSIQKFIHHAFSILLIAVSSWFIVASTIAIRDLVFDSLDRQDSSNVRFKSLKTQINIIIRFADTIILIIAAGSILMTFDTVKQIGVSILASAGVAGIIAGFAAKQSFATFAAGIQIVFSQPVKLNDVVIVENEYGTIEDITLTYVVIRLWDKRRLIVPVTWFLENIFQNWTYKDGELIGSVIFYTDFKVDINEIRNAVKRLLEKNVLWDKKTYSLQVTDVNEKSIQVRALVSANNSSDLWDLRCQIREEIIEYLNQKHPDFSPYDRRKELGLL